LNTKEDILNNVDIQTVDSHCKEKNTI